MIPAVEKINNFYKKFNNELKLKVEDLIETSVNTSTITEMGLKDDIDYLTALATLTKSMNCSFKVLTVPQLSYANAYQCMIHILPNDISYTELPVLTGWGAADQLIDAKQTAAGNAIKLLSLMRVNKKERASEENTVSV